MAILSLTACGWADVPSARSTTGRSPTLAEVPDKDETVRGADEPPVVRLEIGERLRNRPLVRSEPITEAIIIPNTNLSAVPVTAALQAVLAGTDIALSWDSNVFDDHLVTVTNISGPLSQVVEKICGAARIFCTYHRGLLELKERETFVVDLPSVPTMGAASATNTMADTIGVLSGGGDIRVDTQGGNLIYTTTVDGQDKVREYLEELRNGRPLVVMQLYIWEVVLNKEMGAGINWSNFKLDTLGGKSQSLLLQQDILGNTTDATTGFTSLASPGVTLGAKIAGHIDADAVMKFLSTQGQVQTISNPQLTFVSGSNAEFRVGGEQRYISQVGTLTTGSVSGSNATNTGVGNNTVSTDKIETGLTVSMGGNYEGGVISAILQLETQDIVSLNQTASSGGIINLPETSQRKVTTTLRVRPGDNLVLAGLVTSRDQNNREGIALPFGGRVPTYGDDQARNTEMVILVKPAVVLFSDKDVETKAAQTERRQDKPAATVATSSLPDPIIIDKGGAQTLKLPARPSVSGIGEQQPLQTPSVPAAPEPMASPAPDGAPVDRRLMQRGFSHAYNDLLAPTSMNGSAP